MKRKNKKLTKREKIEKGLKRPKRSKYQEKRVVEE
tara:strand:+ start:7957 stop:8061 length:105 start_codon:yes stop_codon:yes gene_type:complete